MKWDQVRFQRMMKEYDKSGLEGWKKVSKFLLDSDPRTLHFVMCLFKSRYQPGYMKKRGRRRNLNHLQRSIIKSVQQKNHVSMSPTAR